MRVNTTTGQVGSKKNGILLLLSLMIWSLFPVVPAFGIPPGSIQGRVVNSETLQGIDQVYLVIDGTSFFMATDRDGKYQFSGIPAKQYNLKVYRLGYKEMSKQIRVISDSTITVNFMLREAPIAGLEVTIEEHRRSRPVADDIELEMSGKHLQKNLGGTIAETIDEEPGISQRTMGPAPARPVLRGLSGDRVKILEDGGETGDLSATSADHAVSIEPVTTKRIEVIRGPATLLYTSNAMGGVVNIIRYTADRKQLTQIRGMSQVQSETVNSAYSGGANFILPLGTLQASAGGSYRNSGDTKTPTGTLKNSAIRTMTASTGLTWFGNTGSITLTGRYYESDYGIPGGFVGAHPNGVDIDLVRRQIGMKGEKKFRSRWVEKIDWQSEFTHYHHREYEANGNVGIEYGVLTTNIRSIVTLKDVNRWQNGTLGVWTEFRDFASGGFAFTPNTEEYSYALFGYHEIDFPQVLLRGALRAGHRQVIPEEEYLSDRIGRVRGRNFSNIAASLTAEYSFSPQWTTGINVMRSYRAPLLEELFSEGPHLAAYSFEIGNPDLATESSLGGEVFLAYDSYLWHWKMSAFQNIFSGFIYPKNTGEINYRTLLPIYQYSGLDAIFRGVEAESHGDFTEHWSGRLAISYVYATLTDKDQPVPRIPPLNGKVSIKYNLHQFTMGGTVRGAAQQNRVAEFETPTKGYVVMDLNAQWTLPQDRYIHSFVLSVSNLFDTEYRKHLSRVKVIMPEPGRNLKLNYRVYF